jgi:hypothetical protein
VRFCSGAWRDGRLTFCKPPFVLLDLEVLRQGRVVGRIADKDDEFAGIDLPVFLLFTPVSE